MARIVFKDNTLDGSDCRCNGIVMQGFRNPDAVGSYMLVDGDRIEMLGRLIDTPITFNISISSDGLMTVRMGKEHLDIKTAMLPHPSRDTIMMSCSGADVSFLNIVAR